MGGGGGGKELGQGSAMQSFLHLSPDPWGMPCATLGVRGRMAMVRALTQRKQHLRRGLPRRPACVHWPLLLRQLTPLLL